MAELWSVNSVLIRQKIKMEGGGAKKGTKKRNKKPTGRGEKRRPRVRAGKELHQTDRIETELGGHRVRWGHQRTGEEE